MAISNKNESKRFVAARAACDVKSVSLDALLSSSLFRVIKVLSCSAMTIQDQVEGEALQLDYATRCKSLDFSPDASQIHPDRFA
jgi:hypothetical protein